MGRLVSHRDGRLRVHAGTWGFQRPSPPSIPPCLVGSTASPGEPCHDVGKCPSLVGIPCRELRTTEWVFPHLQGSGRPFVLPQGDLDPGGDGAGHGNRGLQPLRTPGQADGLPWAGAERAFEWRHEGGGLDHEGGQQPGPACAGAGRVDPPLPVSARSGAEAPPGGPATRCHRPQLEGTAPAQQGVKRLAFRKNNQIAAVAVARELVGFVWALTQESVVEIEAGRRAA